MDLLLAHGADVQAEDFKGNTPAHIAASHGHILLLTKLLQVCKALSVLSHRSTCMMHPMWGNKT